MGVGLVVLGSAFTGGKPGGLGHPLLTIDAAGKRQIGCDPPNLASHPGGDLFEVIDAKLVQALLVDRTHALDPLQVVRAAAARGLEGAGPLADRVGLLLRRRVGRQGRKSRLDVRGFRFRMRVCSGIVQGRRRLVVRGRRRDRRAMTVGAIEARKRGQAADRLRRDAPDLRTGPDRTARRQDRRATWRRFSGVRSS